jgi:cysteine desulfurase
MGVYLDHAATTPVRPEVAAVVASALRTPGNPSSLHAAGRLARKSVEESRERLAAALGARPGEVVFTSGGTEADNLAVKGLFWSRRTADPRRVRILASAVEHPAVREAVRWLGDLAGAEVEWLPVDGRGRLDVGALRSALDRDPASVALVTVMWANNEVGTLQPVGEVVAAAHAAGVPVHADAVQAVGQVPVDFGASGVAALLVRADVDLVPVLHGGGQERDVRSGTVDVAGAAGLAAAAAAATEAQPDEQQRRGALRNDLVDAVRAAVPDAVLNGDPSGNGRLPGNAHFSFPGCDGDSLLMLLDGAGIECSTGSACSAGVAQPSHVLEAMEVPEDLARGSLRFTLGDTSTPTDVAALGAVLGPIVERARAARAADRRRVG